MIESEIEESKRSEAKSRFLLTSSIYRRCCSAHCDDFLKLFVNDQLAQKFYICLQKHGLPLLPPSSTQPAESFLNPSSSSSTDHPAAAETGENTVLPSTPTPAVLSDHPESNAVLHSTEGDKQGVKENISEDNQEEEMISRMPGCRLSNLLMAVLLADISLDIQLEVAALLLGAFHAADSVDAVFQSIPSIQILFNRVRADQEHGVFLDKQFSKGALCIHNSRCTIGSLS